jgi:hypothetical protein
MDSGATVGSSEHPIKKRQKMKPIMQEEFFIGGKISNFEYGT